MPSFSSSSRRSKIRATLFGERLASRSIEPIAPNSSADSEPLPSVSTSANLSSRFSSILARSASRAASRSSLEIFPSSSASHFERLSLARSLRASLAACFSSSSRTPSSLRSYFTRNSGKLPFPNTLPSSPSGASGFSGRSGLSCASPSGVSGFSGLSGRSGFSHAFGGLGIHHPQLQPLWPADEKVEDSKTRVSVSAKYFIIFRG